MNWTLSHRFDPLAVAIADRHYNRQKVGTPQFVPPGRCLVLLAGTGSRARPSAPALWVTSWPFAEYTKHQWAGAWVNSLFRREGGDVASSLILDAVAATRWYFGKAPTLGMVTFVDAAKVRHKRDPGRCYLRAGFHRVGETQGGLLAFQMLPSEMPEPAPPLGATLDLLDGLDVA